MDLRVLIVSEDLLARAGLAALLAGQSGYAVVGQVTGEGDLQAELEAHRLDVILWDLGWKASLAVERMANRRGATAPVVPVVALLPDKDHAAAAWSAGARGLLLREADVAALLTAMNAVGEGLIVLAPELSIALPGTGGRESVAPAEELTPREMAVLRLLAEGLPNKSIARRLGISEHTVKFHLNSVMGKLGAQSRTEAVVMATRLGLLLL